MPRHLLSLTALGRHGARDPIVPATTAVVTPAATPEPNASGNERIQAVISRSLTRRSMLKGALGGAGCPGASFAARPPPLRQHLLVPRPRSPQLPSRQGGPERARRRGGADGLQGATWSSAGATPCSPLLLPST